MVYIFMYPAPTASAPLHVVTRIIILSQGSDWGSGVIGS